jgi:hypothetical protein
MTQLKPMVFFVRLACARIGMEWHMKNGHPIPVVGRTA